MRCFYRGPRRRDGRDAGGGSYLSCHCLLPLIEVGFPFLDLDDLVEIGFRVALPGFDLALDQPVVWRIDILVERRGNLLHLERREEPVVDAFLGGKGVVSLVGEDVAVGKEENARTARWLAAQGPAAVGQFS